MVVLVEPDVMSLQEYAIRTGRSYRAAFAEMQEGRLPVKAFRIGGSWRINRRAFERWLAEVSGEELPADAAGVAHVGDSR